MNLPSISPVEGLLLTEREYQAEVIAKLQAQHFQQQLDIERRKAMFEHQERLHRSRMQVAQLAIQAQLIMDVAAAMKSSGRKSG